MHHSLINKIDVVAYSCIMNSLPPVASHLEVVEKALKSGAHNEREAGYIRAAKAYASGNLLQCVDEFTAIVRDYPLG